VSKGVFGIIVGALAVALVAAGCGSGGSDPVTKAEYVKEANAVCDRGERERSEAISEYGETTNQSLPQKQLQKGLVEAALPSYQNLSSELSALPVPKEGAKQVEEFDRAFGAAVEAMEARWHVAIDNPALFGEANDIAEKIGATECLI
jgi:hypothetical protein